MEYKSIWKEDFAKLEGEIKRLDAKIDFKVSDLRSDLRTEIKESKVDTVKWMVSLFIAFMMMILGLYFKK